MPELLGKLMCVIMLPVLLGGCFGINEFENLAEKKVYEWEKEFVVVTEVGAPDLSPISLSVPNRKRLLNVFESLVTTDENFGIEPGLAVAWGRISDTEWEFKLREGVKFHDGSTLDSDDVLCSFDVAKNNEESDLRNVLSMVADVNAVDDYTVRITTRVPDPLLLQKIAQVLIVPVGVKDILPTIPAGTGPYELVDNSEAVTKLKFFEEYWGEKPFVRRASFRVADDSVERQALAVTGDCGEYVGKKEFLCGLLTAVPSSTLDRMHEDWRVYEFSNLGATYAVFNYHSDIWEDEFLQEALIKMVDPYEISELSGVLTRPASQFFSSGVFGHNSEIEVPGQNVAQAKEIFPAEKKGLKLVLDYYPDFERLANYVRETWRELGVVVSLNEVQNANEMQKRAENGESDIYFLSWQVENGDAGNFLTQAVHTPTGDGSYGQFNWSGYSYEPVDRLIEKSGSNLHWQERLKQLRTASELMVEKERYGIPLFESITMHALRDDMYFVPRADGMVILKSIQPNLQKE